MLLARIPLRPALLATLLVAAAACSSAAPKPATTPSPVVTEASIPPPPASIVQLLKAAAVQEELARARTGVYLDANDLGYIVKAGVIFEAISTFDSYCLDLSITEDSQPYKLDGVMHGVIVPGRCARPDQLSGSVLPASPSSP